MPDANHNLAFTAQPSCIKLILGLSVSVALSVSASRVKIASQVETALICDPVVRLPANCAFPVGASNATLGVDHATHQVNPLPAVLLIFVFIEYHVTGPYVCVAAVFHIDISY